MAFNSFKFLLIFPMIFGIHWAIPAKWNQIRKLFLIIVSYLLYMNWMAKYEPAIRLCEQNNISVYNNINNQVFAQNAELFQDFSHLNSNGAELYTKTILAIIKQNIR